ncbi:sensor histidine kinase [Mucisphaera calidilacus]|uniref:histidine kinase n=1 Tax=Mucisphaera calidilacus TaxID=2527982 RepID=A0A518BXC6_9BACT|nr:HAMP domain-containing sensor histidine kinase [Mucisphaera calidilacus]QDU71615.1 Non-motile and phage-resistance protein [Mucisphaera calidilacus]
MLKLKPIRISLANKCQLLFGAAVVLILTAALIVVAMRMQALVEAAPLERARDFATAWLNNHIRLGNALLTIEEGGRGLPPDRDFGLTLIEDFEFERASGLDPFLARTIDRFSTTRKHQTFDIAEDTAGRRFYRYARAVRSSDLVSAQQLATGNGQAQEPIGPPEMILLIQLRDDRVAVEAATNRIYLVGAGTLSGLLAIGVFWFITTRIILSPVRVLRDYAGQVSRGDLNIRSDINTGDEFEELSDVFNQMLESIRDNQGRLSDANKSLDVKLGELAASNVALYEANKVKGEFLANVSHELRTPLNSILGFAEVLSESLSARTGPVDEKRKRYVGNILASSRHLLNLINDLLEVAKIEAGRVEVRIAPVSVDDLTEGLINLMRLQAENRSIALKRRVEPDLPILETDANKLQQILFNFLSNAVKFTPDMGTITLSASLIPEIPHTKPAQVRLSVSDTGPGIAPEDQQKIFEKFTTLDPSVTKEHGGTGLGLTICSELAELLGGSIELDSELGKGATFSLLVPVKAEPVGPIRRPPSGHGSEILAGEL